MSSWKAKVYPPRGRYSLLIPKCIKYTTKNNQSGVTEHSIWVSHNVDKETWQKSMNLVM